MCALNFFPSGRKLNEIGSFLPSVLVMAPTNHCFPLRRAIVAYFPISPESTFVSSQTVGRFLKNSVSGIPESISGCLLYTSDAADEEDSVDLGGRRIIKK